jgi:zinc D-Ala-D-Ala carboxypeptidase
VHLSANFTLDEAVKSQTALRCGIDNTPNAEEIECLRRVAQHILQPVRDHFGIPFTPSSWFRCAALCRQIGSAETSQHAKGQAADFEVPGVANLALAQWIAANLDFDQLILEYWEAGKPAAGWVHCSYLGAGANRREVLRFDGRRYLVGLG